MIHPRQSNEYVVELESGYKPKLRFVSWTTNSAPGFDKPWGACFISNILSVPNNNIRNFKNELLSIPSGRTITKVVYLFILLKGKKS